MTLAERCYEYMFRGCTGLTQAPALPATNLAEYCYGSMFYKCTGIRLNTNAPGAAWSIPANAMEATDWNLNMFADTSGTFTNGPAVGTIYYLASGNPAAPLFATDGTALVFDGTTLSIKITNAESGIWSLYAVDDLTQTSWTQIDG